MPPAPLARRVEILEDRVDALTQLPARVTAVETQLVSLRGEVSVLRDEFAAFRSDVRTEFEDTRRQMRVLHEDVISRIALLQEGLPRANDRRPRPRKGR